MDQSRIESAAAFLASLRAPDAVPASNLPEDLRPTTEAETVAIQLATLAKLGPIGGWKVGAASASALPVASPPPRHRGRNRLSLRPSLAVARRAL